MLFSIIIPTRDRVDALDRCLASLAALEFSPDQFEVLVVDDGSHRPVDEVVARYGEHLPVRMLVQQNRGPAAARNLGLKNARGRYVVFTDDDCRADAQWLRAYLEAFAEQPESAWGGEILPAPENSLAGVAAQLLVTYLYEYPVAHLRFFCTNNLAFPREALAGLGGFDEHFPLAAAEDRDLCARWGTRYPLAYAPAARVYHRQELTFLGFLQQQFRYGRGAFHFQVRRRQREEEPLRVEPLHFYARLLAYPWRSEDSPRAAALTMLLALSQLANFCGYSYERRK